MSIKQFENGSFLVAGRDLENYLLNRRNKYSVDCKFCSHEDEKDNLICDECSILGDESCSCHINPPCSKCENSRFEVSPHLINYKHYKDGKWRWECFKSNEDVFDKFKKIEESGMILSAETITTGEIVIYLGLDDDVEEEEIKICSEKKYFKEEVEKMIIENSK